MILEVNKFKRESASHGSRVPFALLPFEHRSIKLLKQIKQIKQIYLGKEINLGNQQR